VIATCKLCGHLMPTNEEMFDYHGFSGPCPKSPLKKVQLDPSGEPKTELTLLERKAIEVLNSIKAAADGGGLVHLTVEMQMGIDVVLAIATVRRVGVA